MGAECIMDLLARIDLDELSYNYNANTETSKQRKMKLLKDYKLLNPSVSLT
jgi:DNA-directed RNA polymerase subunit beta'